MSSSVPKKPSAVLRYRLPQVIFVPVVGLLFLHLHLSFVCEISADGLRIVLPRHVAEAEAARLSGLSVSSVRNAAELVLHRDVQPVVFAVGRAVFRSIEAIRVVAYAAIAAHVLETIYAVKVCLESNASAAVTIQYAVGVFIGGFTQLSVLKAQIRRLHKTA